LKKQIKKMNKVHLILLDVLIKVIIMILKIK